MRKTTPKWLEYLICWRTHSSSIMCACKYSPQISPAMVSQKPISVRIDLGVLEQLEAESRATGIPKNMLINRAIKHYVRIVDIIRRTRANGFKPIDTAALSGELKIIADKMNRRYDI